MAKEIIKYSEDEVKNDSRLDWKKYNRLNR